MEEELGKMLAEINSDIARLDAEIAGPERIYVGDNLWSTYTFDETGAREMHAMTKGDPPGDPDVTPPRVSVTKYLDAYRSEREVKEIVQYRHLVNRLLLDMTETGMRALGVFERFSDIMNALPRNQQEWDEVEMPAGLGDAADNGLELPPKRDDEPGGAYWKRVTGGLMAEHHFHTSAVADLASVYGRAHEAMERAIALHKKRQEVIAEESFVSCSAISRGEFPHEVVNWGIYELMKPAFEEMAGARPDGAAGAKS